MPHKRKAAKESQRLDRKNIYRVAAVVRELLAVALGAKQQPEYDISADQRWEALKFVADVASGDHATSASKSGLRSAQSASAVEDHSQKGARALGEGGSGAG